MNRTGPFLLAAFLFVAAAALEVAGDAVIRVGLRGRSGWIIVLGALMLAAYGVVVNLIPWDFSRLLGTYIAVFAVVAILVGRFHFGDSVPLSTWLGLALIVLGAAVIQLGSR